MAGRSNLPTKENPDYDSQILLKIFAYIEKRVIIIIIIIIIAIDETKEHIWKHVYIYIFSFKKYTLV